jgi:hypothetical protein
VKVPQTNAAASRTLDRGAAAQQSGDRETAKRAAYGRRSKLCCTAGFLQVLPGHGCVDLLPTARWLKAPTWWWAGARAASKINEMRSASGLLLSASWLPVREETTRRLQTVAQSIDGNVETMW